MENKTFSFHEKEAKRKGIGFMQCDTMRSMMQLRTAKKQTNRFNFCAHRCPGQRLSDYAIAISLLHFAKELNN